jgi:predicted O-methyltransferase YrrM
MKNKIITKIKSGIKKYLWIIDFFLVIPLVPSSFLMKLYRRIGSKRLPNSTRILRKVGVFPVIRNYYEPLFDTHLLDRNRLFTRNLPGLKLDTKFQKSYLNKLKYSDELVNLNLTEKSEENLSFIINNGSFESGDAEFLYQFIRDVKPKKIIEIGGGESTKIIQLALRKNLIPFEHACIEPYEMEWLNNFEGINLIRSKVEDLEIDWQKVLKPSDILFIDSSHIIRPQGDVLFEYLEILPQLAKGVYIHIHDIFTPKDYPANMLVDEIRFWNEQYLLEAVLSNSNRYRIVASLNYLKNNYFSNLKEIAPYLTLANEPGSIYLEVVN